MRLVFSIVLGLGLIGATPALHAQTGCQPTIEKPCQSLSERAKTDAETYKYLERKRSTGDRPPSDYIDQRLKLDRDTSFGLGNGAGFGLEKKF